MSAVTLMQGDCCEELNGIPAHSVNRLLHRNQNLPRVRLPNRRLRRLPNLRQRRLSGVMLPLQHGVKPTARLPVTRLV